MQEADHDEALAHWANGQIQAALGKGRDKGRAGWHDPAQCPIERLETLARQHFDRGPHQFVDAAVLLLMHAYRTAQTEEAA